MKILAKFIFTKILGWKLIGSFPKNTQKYVLIGVPHTSKMDFVIGMLVKLMTKEKINFIGKSSLFKAPFGFFFRALGGTPVDRSKSNNLVDAIIHIFNSKKEFRLAMSPEGTRKKVNKWKTGFYYIAKGAKVPVVLFTFDFGKKQVALSAPYHLSDDKEKDFNYFYNYFKDVKGKYPNLQ